MNPFKISERREEFRQEGCVRSQLRYFKQIDPENQRKISEKAFSISERLFQDLNRKTKNRYKK